MLDEPFIPFGFQYYRSPTPLKSEWEKDLSNIASMGFNTVKLWVQWRASHPEPGRFEFGDIQELMDLSHQYGLKVVLNVIFDVAPVWIYKQYPDSKMITADGHVLEPQALSCRQIGGAPGPCLHHEESNRWKDLFLAEAVKKFSGHPAMYIWDLWNEPELTTSIKRELSFANQVCYCTHSLNQFPVWLERKYTKIGRLNDKWQRSYLQWSDVEAPRGQALINDFIDWRTFFIESLTADLKRHIAVVKSLDMDHSVMCHTVPAPIFNLITCASDDFQLADPCDLFGNSLGSSAWAADLLKSAAKGKKLINSEIHAMPGMTSLKPQKLEWNRLKEHILIPLARGITGFLFWQYRPEILGVESPAWGHTYLNGDPTPWLEDTARLNVIVQEHHDLLVHGTRKSDGIAILYSAEGQLANFSVFGHLQTYEDSIQGTHKLLHDLNYKVEFIHEKDLDSLIKEYKCLWMPFPIYLNNDLCSIVRKWVEEGGTLISECSFGMLQAEYGFHSSKIPSYDFDQVFGVEEQWVHSVKQLDHGYHEMQLTEKRASIAINWQHPDKVEESMRFSGAYYQTDISCSSGVEVLAQFESGQGAAITCNNYGKGKAIWAGTLIGAAYWMESNMETRNFIRHLLINQGLQPYVKVNIEGVRVDVLEQATDLNHIEAMIFVHNESVEAMTVVVEMPITKFVSCTNWFDEGVATINGEKLTVTVEASDIQVFRCKLTKEL